jgi:hypothetical protein
MLTPRDPRSGRRPTSREFRQITQKGTGEIFLFSQYVYRPLSTWVTRLYVALGISPNGATLHSLLLALAGAVALLWPRTATYLFAAAALQAYFILDHVDGEVARWEFWRGTRTPSADGEYFDYWVHLHSLNVAFAALGVGVALRTGQPLWAVVGLVADNCLGSFPKLALGRTMWVMYRRRPDVVEHPGFAQPLAAVTDTDGTQVMSGTLTLRQRLVHAARELLFYPGCLIVLSVTLVADAMLMRERSVTVPPASAGYLVFFTLAAGASKVRRTAKSMSQLRALSQPPRPVAAASPATEPAA